MRRRSAADLLTGCLGVASVPLIVGTLGYWVAPDTVVFEGQKVLGRLGHGASAREVALALEGEARRAWLRRAVEAGDVTAAVLLADDLLGLDPLSGSHDVDLAEGAEEEALELYRLAAERDDVIGAARYGACLVVGVGGPRDPESGAGWLSRAGERADEVECFDSPLAYRERRARLSRRRADPGWDPTIDPMTALGILHERGLGVPQDDASAAESYRRALRWKRTRTTETLEQSESSDSAEYRLGQLLVRRPELRAIDDPDELRLFLRELGELTRPGCVRISAPSRRR